MVAFVVYCGLLYHAPPIAFGIVTYVALGWIRERKAGAETRCRKCGYILHGITEPRCPECGERI